MSWRNLLLLLKEPVEVNDGISGSCSLGTVATEATASGTGKPVAYASRIHGKALPGDTLQICRRHFKQLGGVESSNPYRFWKISPKDLSELN